jgi:hypothetical protein
LVLLKTVWYQGVGTHVTIPLKTTDNLHYIQFLPYRDACEKLLRSTGEETFFLTDRSQPDIVKQRRRAKLEALAFDSGITRSVYTSSAILTAYSILSASRRSLSRHVASLLSR